jgi:thiol-disulfide isomerase/thioredoxin
MEPTPRMADTGTEDDMSELRSFTEGEVASLHHTGEWINSAPLTAADLQGRVVLVDFWTYSCINWLRTLPYVRAWSRKYAEHGLVMIGVHTPEFEFEHDLDNVRRAVRERQIHYPIVIDNDYAIWNAFGNHYWPALYFVDAHGRVRHHHYGEGEYAQSEIVLQNLLADAGVANVGDELVSVAANGAEAEADWASLQSPETYLGYDRAEHFQSHGGAAVDTRRAYALPERLRQDHWALAGDWTVGNEAIVANERDGTIAYRFHARDLHLVMGPAGRGAAVRFRVLVDGRPPGADHGLDVDEHGNGTVTEPRLHQLIRQSGEVGEHTFEVTFLDPGVAAYVFTFG